jgi:hypothetical protein
MSEKSASISLHQGILRKTFAVEVLGKLGYPMKDVDIVIMLGGEGSLDAERPVTRVDARTDGIGRASISYCRLAHESGDLGGELRAACPAEVADLQVHLVSVTPDVRR